MLKEIQSLLAMRNDGQWSVRSQAPWWFDTAYANTVPVTSKPGFGMVLERKLIILVWSMGLMAKDVGNDLVETLCGVMLHQYFGGLLGSLGV